MLSLFERIKGFLLFAFKTVLLPTPNLTSKFLSLLLLLLRKRFNDMTTKVQSKLRRSYVVTILALASFESLTESHVDEGLSGI